MPVISYLHTGNRTIRYWSVGADTLPVVLLIHGAPGSMVKYRGWFRDSNLYQRVHLVAVDRPGYGKSGYGRAETSVARQAAFLAPLLKQLSTRGTVALCGSSYGGPIAAKLAMDYPEKVKSLVLQSASVEPGSEKVPRIAYWIRSPLGVVFPGWARVATKEKFRHRQALEEIQDEWDKIQCPTWILHGDLDDLIYPSNANYAFEHLQCTPEKHLICLDNATHRIYWHQPDTIKYYILKARE